MPRYIDLGPSKGSLMRRRVAGQPRVNQWKLDNKAPQCLECGPSARGRLTSGKEIYPHREELWRLPMYVCPNDPTHYVGCHPGTNNSLGYMCGRHIRKLRTELHGVFDPIYKAKRKHLSKKTPEWYRCRNDTYAWLSRKLYGEQREIHVSQLSRQDLQRAIEICKPWAVLAEAILSGKEKQGG